MTKDLIRKQAGKETRMMRRQSSEAAAMSVWLYVESSFCVLVKDWIWENSPLVAVGQLVESVTRNDVSAHEADGRVTVSTLLTKDWTSENGVEATLFAKVNLHLERTSDAQHMTYKRDSEEQKPNYIWSKYVQYEH